MLAIFNYFLSKHKKNEALIKAHVESFGNIQRPSLFSSSFGNNMLSFRLFTHFLNSSQIFSKNIITL
jgi:hypothetical protein